MKRIEPEHVERLAETVDEAADHHEDHDCGVTPLLRDVGAALRQVGGEMRKAAGEGPAQVASHAYRKGWEGIFGKKQPVGQT